MIIYSPCLHIEIDELMSFQIFEVQFNKVLGLIDGYLGQYVF